MFTLNLKPIFLARGISNPYAYLVQNGFNYHTAHKLLNYPFTVINLKHLAQVCNLLLCTPNDILIYTPAKNQTLSPGHPLSTLKQQNFPQINIANALKTLSVQQLQQIAQIIQPTNTNT